MGPLPLPLLLWQLKQLARVCWMLEPPRPGDPRQLVGVVTDDDDQRIRDGRAAAPMVPTWRPGNRSASSLAGTDSRSLVSAGDA